MSGHNHVWAQIKCVWAQTCLGTVMYVLNHVGTIMFGHKRVWAQTCLGTNVSGHSRVGPIMYGHESGGTIFCPKSSSDSTKRQKISRIYIIHCPILIKKRMARTANASWRGYYIIRTFRPSRPFSTNF